MSINKISLILITICVSSCAMFGGSNTSNKSNKSKKSSLPKAMVPKEPGGRGNNWRYLGVSDDGMVITEIDNNSIKQVNTTANIYYYQDRKTITNPQEFSYPSNVRFKYVISEWNVSCDDKRYTLLQNTLYNESGSEIKKNSYQDLNAWRKIDNNSIADTQYQFICNNKNRNLGY